MRRKGTRRSVFALALVLALLGGVSLVARSSVSPNAGEAEGVDALLGGDGALPVLELETRSGALPGDEAEPGALRLTEPDGAGGRRVVGTAVEIRLRGNTSRRFPKKSYRVELVDGEGDERKLSLCGLRRDGDWILNPLYSDTSKLREALSAWLWERMNSCGDAAQGSGLAYAEVWLNGEYRGLYGVQERVDRKQVDADRQRGILYKVTANDRPGVRELLEAGGAEACRGLELAYAGSEVGSPWLPAADYMALLEGEAPPGSARLSRENAVDYALWSMLAQARDNHFKNMYIHCAPEGDGYVLYRIPWDLNYTLGDMWSGESPGTNYVAYEIGEFAPDDGMKALMAEDPGLMDALRSRWAELRAGEITEERLLERARALFGALYPAILRDTERWPECGMGEGSAANIRDIEDYFRATLAGMDRYFGLARAG